MIEFLKKMLLGDRVRKLEMEVKALTRALQEAQILDSEVPFVYRWATSTLDPHVKHTLCVLQDQIDWLKKAVNLLNEKQCDTHAAIDKIMDVVGLEKVLLPARGDTYIIRKKKKARRKAK